MLDTVPWPLLYNKDPLDSAHTCVGGPDLLPSKTLACKLQFYTLASVAHQ